MPHIQKVAEKFQPFWTNMIVDQQRDVMISAAATAVGINMTFLLPYSMLRKGWDKYFRGLAIFDLSTGLFIPFILATGCVVIASSSQFHGQPAEGFVSKVPGGEITGEPAKNLIGPYKGLLKDRLKFEIGEEEFAKLTPEQVQAKSEHLPWADKRMSATAAAFSIIDTRAPSSMSLKFCGDINGGTAADSKNAISKLLRTISLQNLTCPATRWKRVSMTESGLVAISHNRFSNPIRLVAIEKGPARGTLTSASGHSLATRLAASIAIGMRPSVFGLNGSRFINSFVVEYGCL